MAETINTPETEMPAADVVNLVRLCEENNIEIYIDGGWRVDTLIGEQTQDLFISKGLAQ